MPFNKTDVCEKKEECFYKNPMYLGPLIIVGGLGAGYLLCPESKDEASPNNRTIRKSLMFGGVLAGGVIITNHLMKKTKY